MSKSSDDIKEEERRQKEKKGEFDYNKTRLM